MESTVVKIVENRGLWCVKWQRWVNFVPHAIFSNSKQQTVVDFCGRYVTASTLHFLGERFLPAIVF